MPLINCKCPSCGASLKINDAAKGTLRCPYCGSEYLAENAITNVTNVTNVSTINNYSGATIIKDMGKEDFDIVQGVLNKYNGNESEVIIPDTVRKINCEFNEYVKKILISSSVVDINPSVIRNVIPVLDISKNSLFKIENGILYRNDVAIAYGPEVKEYHLKNGEQYDLNLFDFIENCTLVSDVFLPSGIESYLYYKTLSGRANIHIAEYNSTYAVDFPNIENDEIIYIAEMPAKIKKKLFYYGKALEIDKLYDDLNSAKQKCEQIKNQMNNITTRYSKFCKQYADHKESISKNIGGIIAFGIVLSIFVFIAIITSLVQENGRVTGISTLIFLGIPAAILIIVFLCKAIDHQRKAEVFEPAVKKYNAEIAKSKALLKEAEDKKLKIIQEINILGQ